MATPQNPYGIPSTIDTTVLNTSLADFQKRLVDNVYNSNVILRLANEAGTKKMINGGASIVETLIKGVGQIVAVVVALSATLAAT